MNKVLIIIFRCKLWIEACDRPDLIEKTWKNLKNSYICSAHFEKHLYGKKSLKKIAIPTLLLPTKGTRSVHTQTYPKVSILNVVVLVGTEKPLENQEQAGPSSKFSSVIETTTKYVDCSPQTLAQLTDFTPQID